MMLETCMVVVLYSRASHIGDKMYEITRNNRHSLVNAPLAKTSQCYHFSDSAMPTTMTEVDHHNISPEVVDTISTATTNLPSRDHPPQEITRQGTTPQGNAGASK